ncbi:MAG: hypothetical protein I8H75_00595 [Myxococcaceae bacterium]|nr:hypothetical protein [Myxococcaceae bacterium]MBH2005840.1 hypothetical protein [Myxococcaceae bacterium]
MMKNLLGALIVCILCFEVGCSANSESTQSANVQSDGVTSTVLNLDYERILQCAYAFYPLGFPTPVSNAMSTFKSCLSTEKGQSIVWSLGKDSMVLPALIGEALPVEQIALLPDLWNTSSPVFQRWPRHFLQAAFEPAQAEGLVHFFSAVWNLTQKSPSDFPADDPYATQFYCGAQSTQNSSECAKGCDRFCDRIASINQAEASVSGMQATLSSASRELGLPAVNTTLSVGSQERLSITNGTFCGTVAFGDKTLTAQGKSDVYIAAMKPDGSFSWVSQIKSGAESSLDSYSVSLLSDGSSLVTGLLSGSATLGQITIASSGQKSAFVAKIRMDGSFAWVSQMTSDQWVEISSISTLANGSSRVTGSFLGTAVFGSKVLSSQGSEGAFIAELNADGSVAWVSPMRANADGWAQGSIVSALADGSALVTGTFQGSVAFGETILNSVGEKDAFIAKIQANGTWSWVTQMSGQVESPTVSVFGDGSSVLAGYFVGDALLGSTRLTAAGTRGLDGFVAKVGADGSFVWIRQMSGADSLWSLAVVALKDGSSVVSGSFYGKTILGDITLNHSGHQDGFMAKLNAQGDFLWAQTMPSTEWMDVYSLSTLSDDSFLLTGIFKQQAIFGNTTLTSAGGLDIFIAKLSSAGAFVWVRQVGGSGDDYGNWVSGSGEPGKGLD